MKKVLSLILTLALLLSCLPATALPVHAVEHAQEMTVTGFHVNPLYNSAPPVIPQTYAASVPEVSCNSEAEAVAYLRQQMTQRAEEVSFRIYMDDFDFSRAYPIFEAALAHTGNPTEGDYLQWQYAYVSYGASGYHDGDQYNMTFTYNIGYYTTAQQEAEMDAAAASLLATLNPNSSSDYENLKTVYDWMCQNITYDYENLYDDSYYLKHTAYAALINGTSVCQGYALLMYRLLLELGIDCRVIVGSSSGESHAWNIVQLDGKYYNLDSTWDATQAQSGRNYKYFLRCDAKFPDHARDPAYGTADFYATYPMSDTDYDPNNIHKHNYQAVVTQPTCNSEGYTTHTCTLCGHSYQDNQVAPLAHSFADGKCSICGASEAMLGDTDGNGKVNLRDVLMLLQYVNGNRAAEEMNLPACHLDSNGRINLRDVLILLQFVNGKPLPA